MTTAYLGLGSNLGERAAVMRTAIAVLDRSPGVKVAAASSLYETVPEGNAPQPLYLNAVARVETTLSAWSLLQLCLGVELAQGRVRKPGETKGPRTLDIDLLLFDRLVLDEHGLQVPHPGLLVRPFVRIPLADVALPGLCHPVTGERLDYSPPSADVRLYLTKWTR